MYERWTYSLYWKREGRGDNGRQGKKRKTVTGNNNEATRLSDRFAGGVQRNSSKKIAHKK